MKKHDPVYEYKQMSKAYDRIELARKRINAVLKDKYNEDTVHIDHAPSDGIILVHHDEDNSPISCESLKVLLSDKITAEEGLDYLKSTAI